MTDNINTRMENVEKIVENMDRKINKIFDVVVGDEKFAQEGIISRLVKLEKAEIKNKAIQNRLIGAFIVGGVIWNILLEAVKIYLKK